MRSGRFERIFGCEAGNYAEPVLRSTPPEQPDYACEVHRQWYEADGQRLREECEALDGDSIAYLCEKLPDGRLGFITEVLDHQIAIVCSCRHPIEPPEIVCMDDLNLSGTVVADGVINLFPDGEFRWHPDVRLVEVIDRVTELLAEAHHDLAGLMLPLNPRMDDYSQNRHVEAAQATRPSPDTGNDAIRKSSWPVQA